MRSLLFLSAILCLTPRTTLAQTAQPTFEVATIKPSDPNAKRNMVGVTTTPNGLEASMATLSALLRVAYGFQQFPLESQITNIPDWAKSQPYDIHAKFSDADLATYSKLSSIEQGRMAFLMLQSLLAERFNLQLHRGSTHLPAYDLVLAKGGPKFKPIPDDDPTLRKGPDGKPFLGVTFFLRDSITVQQQTMAEFATLLTQSPAGPGRPVIDKTGLTGVFTFPLHFKINQTTPPDPDAPSLFTVLQEDLGLKLQPSTATLPTLIIDRLDRPTAN